MLKINDKMSDNEDNITFFLEFRVEEWKKSRVVELKSITESLGIKIKCQTKTVLIDILKKYATDYDENLHNVARVER